ncbi:MAG: N-acetyltransferase [Candidatus Omnitrophica bacterium]|nr:N-acetyltransferase [Candidatus Omnitrophota bacterium]
MFKKATISEAAQIYRLIGFFAKKRLMLVRSLNYIYERIRDFWVYQEGGEVIGCCALAIVGWQDLAEIKSLAVKGKYQGKGIGSALVKKALEEAKSLGLKKVFVLTYAPEFFKKLGFKEIDKEKLPHKVWSDCLNCPEFPDCKEIALIKKL